MSKANRNQKTTKDTSKEATSSAPAPARPSSDSSSARPAASRPPAPAAAPQASPAERLPAAQAVRPLAPPAAPARPMRAVAAAAAPARAEAPALVSTAPAPVARPAPAASAPVRAAPLAAVPPAPAAPAPSLVLAAADQSDSSKKEDKRPPAPKPSKLAKPASKPKAPLAEVAPAAAGPAPRPATVATAAAPRLAAFDHMERERRAVMLPEEGDLKGAAALEFDAGSAPRLSGQLEAGGRLLIRYAPNRSPYQHTTAEGPAWGVQAFVEFRPGGERHTAPAVAFQEDAGRLTGAPVGAPMLISVPKSATSVVLFFKQWTSADRPQEVWDSNWGQNYNFEVKRPQS